MVIMKASDLVLDSQLSFLFKAAPGFSKTISAASFALDGPVYLAYFDKKSPVELLSFFSKLGEVGQKILRNIEFDVYGAHNANEYLNKLIRLADDCRYFAVITDSVTNLTSATVNWSLGFRDNRKSKDKDRIVPDFDEYKVETSIVTQALDISRKLPCHVIWTAHPLPGIKIEGSGSSIKVTKTNPIVTYGSKVAGIVPGNFSEIYHFSKQSSWNQETGKSSIKYLVSPEAIGDDYAKSNLGLKSEFDITDKLFYQVWKEQVKNLREEIENDLRKNPSAPTIVFPNQPTAETKWRT
jgi:hypothetical protein